MHALFNWRRSNWAHTSATHTRTLCYRYEVTFRSKLCPKTYALVCIWNGFLSLRLLLAALVLLFRCRAITKHVCGSCEMQCYQSWGKRLTHICSMSLVAAISMFQAHTHIIDVSSYIYSGPEHILSVFFCCLFIDLLFIGSKYLHADTV